MSMNYEVSNWLAIQVVLLADGVNGSSALVVMG